MKYFSTRNEGKLISFEEALFGGLSDDGGLYIPLEIPKASTSEIERWRSLDFPDLCYEVMSKFISRSEISAHDLRSIVKKAFSTFDNEEVIPLVGLPKKNDQGVSCDRYILELFHGPTLSFKDIALQNLGHLFEYFLDKRKDSPNSEASSKQLVVIGATSGDTGSAAIHGFRNKKRINLFILYPYRMISDVQKLQMTTVTDKNVRVISVDAEFDSCQKIVKEFFNSDLKEKYQLCSINSINIARIICQISYYFYAALKVKPEKGVKVRFVVPSGNYGDALAGIYANLMYENLGIILMSTNQNSGLPELLETGKFCFKDRKSKILKTLTTAMDIVIGSNLERILWQSCFQIALRTHGSDNVSKARRIACERTKAIYDLVLSDESRFLLAADILEEVKTIIKVVAVTDAQVSDTINKYFYSTMKEGTNKLMGTAIDPHTAVGVYVSDTFPATPCTGTIDICLSTASPAKFPDAVIESVNRRIPEEFSNSGFKGISQLDILPKSVKDLFDSAEKEPIFLKIAGSTDSDALKRFNKCIEESMS